MPEVSGGELLMKTEKDISKNIVGWAKDSNYCLKCWNEFVMLTPEEEGNLAKMRRRKIVYNVK